MLTAPNSEIYLLKTPIELDNNNQLNFASAAAQQTYFQGLPKINITEATFQRKDGTLRWPGSMESLLGYNYCMYRNKSHGNKWFYAFVTDIQWASENSSIISLKTDVWQTYQFDLTWHPCFVEREHVNDDTFGKHTVPEGLEYGDYVIATTQKVDLNSSLENCYVVAQVSYLLPGMDVVKNENRVYSGLPQGCWLVGIPIRSGSLWYFNNLSDFILAYDDFGRADAIISLFIIPGDMVTTTLVPLSITTSQSPNGNVWSFGIYIIPSMTTPTIMDTSTITRQTTINSYTPKNNKLFCSPYCFLNVTNNAGSVVSFAWELFNSATPEFVTMGAISEGCDIKITPTNYRNSANAAANYDLSVTCAKYPSLSWSSDHYLNWVAVNGPITEVNAGLSAVSFGVSAIGGMISGDFSGASISGLASNVANLMQQVREAEMTPPSAKGNLTGQNLTYGLDRIGFSLQKMNIRYEYAKMIDDYFSCFGYKVNELKTPNITGRLNWNYVKTVGCNVTADAPQEDIEEIRSLFDRGITIWHNPSTYLDYSQSNTIVT